MVEFNLPPGFVVERLPERYVLFYHHSIGNRVTRIECVATFIGKDTVKQEIEAYAEQALEKLKEEC